MKVGGQALSEGGLLKTGLNAAKAFTSESKGSALVLVV